MNVYNSQPIAPSCCQVPSQVRSNCQSTCANVKSVLPANAQLAMAYIPFQQSGEVYSAQTALSKGTIFPCLDKPFMRGCCK